MENKISLKESTLYWLKLGFISFGGPAAQISMMHDELVDKKKWITDKNFFHALNFTMVLPGPEAQQLATYMGWLIELVKPLLTIYNGVFHLQCNRSTNGSLMWSLCQLPSPFIEGVCMWLSPNK